MRDFWVEYGSMKLGVTPEGGASAPISGGATVTDPVLISGMTRLQAEDV